MRGWMGCLAVALVACGPTTDEGSGDTDVLPAPAAITTPTNACPDLSSTGLVSFKSGGDDRTAHVFFPDGDTTGLPVVFVWHGLTAPGQTVTGTPSGDMSQFLGLEDWANKQDIIVVVPDAVEDTLVIAQVYLWGILYDEDMQRDLTLYDDLRSCVSTELGGDMSRVSSFGFSGGALWNALMLMHRSDTLAAVVSASGGTGQASELLNYSTPDVAVPSLLLDGGANDLWPDASLPLVKFFEATEDLRDNLDADGIYELHCRHDRGHTVTPDHWKASKQWMLRHTFGAPSPYADGTYSAPKGCDAPE